MSHNQMFEHRQLLDKVLHGSDEGVQIDTWQNRTAVERLRLSGMLHVAPVGLVSFITPLHRHCYTVWLYSFPGMKVDAPADVASSTFEFERLIEASVIRMSASELRYTMAVGMDGRPIKRHYQVGKGTRQATA